MTYVSHKIRIYPNKSQEVLLGKSCGVARFAYNLALTEWNNQYEQGEETNEGKLRKWLNAIKREQYPWMMEVSDRCVLYSIKNLGVAFDRFFKYQGGYPTFKKKGVRDSFTLDYEKFTVGNRKIRLSKIGWIKTAEALRFTGKPVWATVSREANRWYIAVQVETEQLKPLP
jgi:putative transposase